MPKYWTKHNAGVKVHGVASVRRFLNGLSRKCLTMSPVFREVGQAAVHIIRKRTLQGIGYDGKRFPPLEKKWAIKRGTDVRRLSSTGDPGKGMLAAVTYRVGDRKVVIYVKQEYPEYIKAEVHNSGMISGRKSGRFKMPRAPWFGLREREYHIMYRFVQKHFIQFVDNYWRHVG